MNVLTDGVTDLVPIHPGSCVVCAQKGHIRFCCTANGYAVFTCDACHADFVYPSPDPEYLKEFYGREEWFEGGETGGYSNYDEQTRSSVEALASLFDRKDSAPRSVLDIGCGYGTHLQLAHERGWTCTGVEISGHARAIAQKRLEPHGVVVASISELPEGSFDLILLLDVIEHLADPYPLFEELLEKHVLTGSSRIVVTTPNAGSDEAIANPAGWQFRHPPSHLTYYSAKSMSTLFRRLGFTQFEVSGLHPTRRDTAQTDMGLERFSGLMGSSTGWRQRSRA